MHLNIISFLSLKKCTHLPNLIFWLSFPRVMWWRWINYYFRSSCLHNYSGLPLFILLVLSMSRSFQQLHQTLPPLLNTLHSSMLTSLLTSFVCFLFSSFYSFCDDKLLEYYIDPIHSVVRRAWIACHFPSKDW